MADGSVGRSSVEFVQPSRRGPDRKGARREDNERIDCLIDCNKVIIAGNRVEQGTHTRGKRGNPNHHQLGRVSRILMGLSLPGWVKQSSTITINAAH